VPRTRVHNLFMRAATWHPFGSEMKDEAALPNRAPAWGQCSARLVAGLRQALFTRGSSTPPCRQYSTLPYANIGTSFRPSSRRRSGKITRP
jgi:hypothetical protein